MSQAALAMPDENELKDVAVLMYKEYCAGENPTVRPAIPVGDAMAVAGYLLVLILSNLDKDERSAAAIEFSQSLFGHVQEMDGMPDHTNPS